MLLSPLPDVLECAFNTLEFIHFGLQSVKLSSPAFDPGIDLSWHGGLSENEGYREPHT